MRASKGFTLIELLVVIAIIGLLASVVLVSLGNARIKARDTQRLANLKQLQNALAIYYQNNSKYPVWNDSTWGRDCNGWTGNGPGIGRQYGSTPLGSDYHGTTNSFLLPMVTDGQIAVVVDDPGHLNCAIQYQSFPISSSSPQGYRIVEFMEAIDKPNLACYPYYVQYLYCVGVDYN